LTIVTKDIDEGGGNIYVYSDEIFN